MMEVRRIQPRGHEPPSLSTAAVDCLSTCDLKAPTAELSGDSGGLDWEEVGLGMFLSNNLTALMKEVPSSDQ